MKKLLPLVKLLFTVVLGLSATRAFSQTTQTFSYTGANQTFTVPAGVTSITVKMWGAGGGQTSFNTSGNGGSGGFIAGTLTVIPGENLAVIVGGGGGATYDLATSTSGGVGGFGGGGAGGSSSVPQYYGGAGGGGRSAIRRSSTELATAGAGGGGGGYYSNFNTPSGGGAGLSGYNRNGVLGGNGAGLFGTTMAGGSGGVGYSTSGANGSFLSGGAGASASNYYAGGGGGAGYFGGGGGGANNTSITTRNSGAGGGGSNYLGGLTTTTNLNGNSGTNNLTVNPPNTADTDYQTGIGCGYAYDNTTNTKGGDGLIIISYSLPCSAFMSTISVGGPARNAGSLYPSLTETIGYLAKCGITQPTTLSLNNSYNSTAETFPIVIPSITGSSLSNTITIKPATGQTPTISGAVANNSIFRFIGGQNIIIDGSNSVGGTTKDLTISNTSTSGNAVLFINGSSNNIVKNTKISAVPSFSATNSGVITFSTAGTTGNNNNKIQNNDVGPLSTVLPYNGIYNSGTSTALQNTNNTIIGNNIFNFSYAGIDDEGFSSGFIYDGNNIYGTQTQTTNTALTGIYLGVNTIFSPIVRNNKIYDLKTTNTNTTNTGYLTGIDIYNIAAGSSCLIYNNMISLYGNGSNAPGIRIAGISDESTAGTSNIYYNSVNIYNNATLTTASFAYLKNFTNTSVIKNNIFSNVRSSSGSGLQYAVAWTGNGSFTSDYNDIYSLGNPKNVFGLHIAANTTTLAAWQTATGQDANSLNIAPPFLSTTDLHLSGCSVLESAGTPVAGITTDIDAGLRSTTKPDIGAHEAKMFFTGASASPTLWNMPSNWSSLYLPTSDKCVNIPAGQNVIVDISTAAAKKLTVDSGGKLAITANNALTVTDVFTNSNTNNLVPSTNPQKYYVTIESDGNLLQTNNVTNVGDIAVKRNINLTGARAQYNYLSSPIVGGNLKDSYVKADGTALANSPLTLYYTESNNKFYTSSGVNISGRALAVKEPAAADFSTPTMEATFKGVPYNGPASFTMVNSALVPSTTSTLGYNLLGNPYPSNIDLNLFYTNNNTTGTMDPTFYFWDSKANGQTAQAGSAYGGQAYATYNAATNTFTKASGDGTAGLKYGSRYLKAGQGFIAKTLAPSLTVNFANTQRTATSDTGFFGKGAKDEPVMNRYWLNLISPTNIASNIAVVYLPGENNGYTKDDSRSFGGSDAIYSVVEDQKISINGKGSFADTDKVALGSNHYVTGIYTIALERSEGVFANGQNIYLKDKQTGIVTNLSEGNYTFTANAGESTGRFEIIYQPEVVLSTGANTKENLIIYRDANDFVVKADSKKITDLEVYDASGRMIYKMQPNSTKAIINADRLNNGVYVLKVNQSGEITTKKVIK